MLVHVINQAFTDGVYPYMLKIANVIQFFKSGKNNSVNNYRPISVLSVGNTKIVETAIKRRPAEFIEVNDIITNCQFGFRKNHYTEAAATKSVDSIRKTIDKNKVAGTIFINLGKTFDMVDHVILLQKLWCKGTYLTNRYQYVQIIKHKSLPQLISVGIPQWSVPGPLLFLIYINGIGSLRLNGSLTLFADGTVVSYCDYTMPQRLETGMQNDLDTLPANLRINRLHSMSSYPLLLVNDYPIMRAQYVKYLGLYIDEHLKWSEHVNIVIHKILLLANVKTEYMVHLRYMIFLWGAARKTILHPLQIIQNKCIKSVFNILKLTSGKDLT
ncbi:hypothetical protein PR048_008213 [Dryococelus australis]|uniref:Reverse transcriptase domain-containing protein n=1 Tax=Dryococelus australis TaxID=614101 RepID=A0ABQ9HWG2_9NEOP|nr:hypothetical protein PR048_008213 [Dryococelus australis]